MATVETTPRFVDKGSDHTVLTFSLKTNNLKQGQVARMHLKPEHLVEAAGVKHISALQPKAVTIATHSNAGLLGVSLYHGADPATGKMQYIDMQNNHALVDHKTNNASIFHAVGGLDTDNFTRTLTIRPSEDQLSEQAPLVNKRLGKIWDGITEEHVTQGVTKSSFNGETRYLVAEKDSTTEKPSAIHRLLEHNKKNTDLFNGVYSEGKARKTTINGQEHYVMTSAHFHQLKNSLADSLRDRSPFRNGIGAEVRKLDDSKPLGTSYVTVTLHRNPLDAKTGVVAMEKIGMTEDDLHGIIGGPPGSKASAKPVATHAGFEDKASDIAKSGLGGPVLTKYHDDEDEAE